MFNRNLLVTFLKLTSGRLFVHVPIPRPFADRFNFGISNITESERKKNKHRALNAEFPFQSHEKVGGGQQTWNRPKNKIHACRRIRQVWISAEDDGFISHNDEHVE